MKHGDDVSLLRTRALAVLQALTKHVNEGPVPQNKHHEFGIELLDIQREVGGLWRSGRFPTFENSRPNSSEGLSDENRRRRRELVTLVSELPPMNLEILEWLGQKEDTEAAFLYAYSRASASMPSGEGRAEFFRRVERIVDSNPVLSEAKAVEVILREAKILYAKIQAATFENLE